MIKTFKRWTFRLAVTGLFIVGLLVTFMLNPILLYAHRTAFGNYSVYHNKPIDKSFPLRLKQADSIIRFSELYDPALKMDICLKDGSAYPAFIKKVMGKDMLSSFYNKMVFTGDVVNYQDNYIELDGHKWNLTQMLAHASVHCLEFHAYGLLKANPIGRHPAWKWEGYPEYIARRTPQNIDLQTGIRTLLQAEHANNNGWITLPDNTEDMTVFYGYRLLVQYCMEIKHLQFMQFMEDTTQETTARQQMMAWYKAQQH